MSKKKEQKLSESHPLSIGEQGDLPGPWCLPLSPPPKDCHYEEQKTKDKE